MERVGFIVYRRLLQKRLDGAHDVAQSAYACKDGPTAPRGRHRVPDLFYRRGCQTRIANGPHGWDDAAPTEVRYAWVSCE